jgi:hypothetical protein
MYPTLVDMTPGVFFIQYSVPQKQPPAKYAFSVFSCCSAGTKFSEIELTQ